jgi:hypothetical protein
LNQRSVTFAWLASILLLAIFAGATWLQVSLTPDAGEQNLEITGYLVYPIVSALILLQAASLLATFFTPLIVGRIIAGVLTPVMVIHGVFVALNLEQAFQTAVSAQIAEITGVVGADSQLQFVAFAGDTYLWVAYLAALVLNSVILGAKALVKLKPAVAKVAEGPEDSIGDLWESQK